MANTDAQVLEQLKLGRDKVLADIIAGENVTMLTIGSKQSSFPASDKTIELLEKMIARYSAKSATGAARTRIRFKR